MNDHTIFVGRLAQLHNLVSKPELNETYAQIQSFLPDKNRFSVQTIPSPNTDDRVLTIAVKLESLKFVAGRSFYDEYPYADDVHIVNFATQAHLLHNGTVLQLGALPRSEVPYTIIFPNSHRVLGKKVALDNDGIPHPTMTLHGDIIVSGHSEENIIEFNDIFFVGIPGLVTCTRGKHITFLRCRFQNMWVTVSTGSDPIIALNSILQKTNTQSDIGTPNVVFENCLFDVGSLSDTSYGVYAGCDGTVTLLNCVIRNCGMGVMVNNGGHASLKHCTIENCVTGAGAKGKTSGFSASDCTISKCRDYGIVTGHGETAIISGCRVEDCGGIGIHVRGSSKITHHAIVRDCYIDGCIDGIWFDMGKVGAHITRTTVRHSRRFGLSIFPGVVGNVEITQCRIMDCVERDLVNGGGVDCRVTVDGIVQETTPGVYAQPTQLHARRCGQLAGICDILCEKCGRKEEPGEKFKKCGQCENVCYCSKECQKAHWKEHKEVCKKQTYEVKQ